MLIISDVSPLEPKNRFCVCACVQTENNQSVGQNSLRFCHAFSLGLNRAISFIPESLRSSL